MDVGSCVATNAPGRCPCDSLTPWPTLPWPLPTSSVPSPLVTEHHWAPDQATLLAHLPSWVAAYGRRCGLSTAAAPSDPDPSLPQCPQAPNTPSLAHVVVVLSGVLESLPVLAALAAGEEALGSAGDAPHGTSPADLAATGPGASHLPGTLPPQSSLLVVPPHGAT